MLRVHDDGIGGFVQTPFISLWSDVIDCGLGRDSVRFDVGLDSVKRCEIKEPL